MVLRPLYIPKELENLSVQNRCDKTTWKAAPPVIYFLALLTPSRNFSFSKLEFNCRFFIESSIAVELKLFLKPSGLFWVLFPSRSSIFLMDTSYAFPAEILFSILTVEITFTRLRRWSKTTTRSVRYSMISGIDNSFSGKGILYT